LLRPAIKLRAIVQWQQPLALRYINKNAAVRGTKGVSLNVNAFCG
jgi:hypothetical protein